MARLEHRVRRLEQLIPKAGRLQILFVDVPGTPAAVALIDSELVPVADVSAFLAKHRADPFNVIGCVCPWTVCGDPRPAWAGPFPRDDKWREGVGSANAETDPLGPRTSPPRREVFSPETELAHDGRKRQEK